MEPLLPPPKTGGRPRTTDLRRVLDAVFYLLRTGSQWRYLPKEFPPWSTVHSYFRTWKRNGQWWKIYQALYPKARALAGKDEQPTAAVMDTQSVTRSRASVKTTEKGALVASTRISKSRAESAQS
jgi:putative transposase